MTRFETTYLGQLRAIVGNRPLLVPGARIVITNEKDEILLQLRSDFHLWGLPGGIAEVNESLLSVVEREVSEETGLTVRNVRPFGFASDPKWETIKFPNGDETQFFVMNFHTADYSGALATDDDETLRLGWFHPNGLPDMLANMKRSVEVYLEFKRTGEFQIF